MTLRSGDIFADRFQIDRKAGAGGMGTVYRAHDMLRNEPVALKLLHEQGMAGSDPDRFVREAQLLAELRHPGIVAYVERERNNRGPREPDNRGAGALPVSASRRC